MMKRSFFLALSILLLSFACKENLNKKLEIKTPARKVLKRSSQKKASGWFDKESLQKLGKILPKKYLLYPGKKLRSNPDIYWMRPMDEKCYKVSFPDGYKSTLLNSLDYVHFSDVYRSDVGLLFSGKPEGIATDLHQTLKKKKLPLGAVGTFYSSGSAISPPGMSYKYQNMVLTEISCPAGKTSLVKTDRGWQDYRNSLKDALKRIPKLKKSHQGKFQKTAKLADSMIWSEKSTGQISLLKKFGFKSCKKGGFGGTEEMNLLPGVPLWVYALTLSNIGIERDIYVGCMVDKKIKLTAYECKRKDI